MKTRICMVCDELSCTRSDHAIADARRREHMAKKLGSHIERGRDGGGARDFLEGKPIHCGSQLELQEIDWRDDDFGSYVIILDRWTSVRYELAWNAKNEQEIVLYKWVGGYSFNLRADGGMRFRWPSRGDS